MARQGLFERSNVSLSLTKWGLIIFNVAFWCLGIVALSVGLRLYIANNEYATFSEGRDLLGSVFLIAVGFGVVIVGFLGIVAAIWESTIIATCFAILVILSFGMYMSAGIWSFVHGDDVRDDVRNDLNRTGLLYENNEAYRDVWNALHRQFDCCGVDNISDWQIFLQERDRAVPDSCCINQTTGCGIVPSATLYTRGCLDELVDYQERQYDIMGPIGIAFGLFQIFGVLLCVLFCVTVQTTKASYDT